MASKKRGLKESVQIWLLTKLLRLFFITEQHLLKIKHINYPKGQFIMSMWHRHQCLTYGIQDKDKFFALISASNDGEIIAEAAKALNIQSIRGSRGRRGVAASLELIDKLKEGNSAAIMVDGPKGPIGVVKDGIVDIAKITGVPIIPAYWTSRDRTFFTFNTWDRFQVPVGLCKSVAIYGEPIYIDSDLPREKFAEKCKEIELVMKKLEQDLNENYDKYLNE